MDITHEDYCNCGQTAEECSDRRQAEAAKSLGQADPVWVAAL